jgi:hypothetical protein
MHTDREWLVPMAAVAAAELTLWLIMYGMGLAHSPLVALYNIVEIIGLAGALIPFFLWHLLRLYREGEARPTRRMARELDHIRIVAIIIAMLLGSIIAGAFSTLKAAIPLAVPFYLDPTLGSFERAIFGTDPWRISHAVLGWATPFVDRFYLLWLPVMLVAFNLVLLSKPSALKSRALVAYVLIWPAVGTLGGYLLSSAGPIFHDALFGGHSGLIAALVREGASGNLQAYHYLWDAYTNRYAALGGGLSAMPSMHIAMACWLALTIRAAAPRWQGVGWMYLVMMWIGSVHLGWHYVSDGAMGIAGALLVWWIAGALRWTTRNNTKRSRPPSAESAGIFSAGQSSDSTRRFGTAPLDVDLKKQRPFTIS